MRTNHYLRSASPKKVLLSTVPVLALLLAEKIFGEEKERKRK